MGKIKDLWNHGSHEIKSMLFQYPCTVAVTVLTTLLVLFFENEIPEDLVYPFLFLSWIGIFFSESAFRKKRLPKIISMIITLGVSLSLAYMNNQVKDITLPEDAWFPRIAITYIIVFLILGFYFCCRNSGKKLPQYGIKVFSNLIKTHIIFLILFIAIFCISEIIYVLFLNNYFFDKELMTLLWGYYVISWVYALTRTETEEETFSKILVKYVLIPLNLVIFGIIYIYVIKILVFREIPSNQIYAILTGLFLFAMPTWTMSEAMEDLSVFNKIASKLPFIFMPLMLLQIYAIGIRIMEFGVTPERYLGVLWILLEIIYLLMHQIKKDSVEKILMIVTGAVIVTFLIPCLNIYNISILSQEYILSAYKKDPDLSAEMKEKIYGAYLYLSDMKDSKKYIEEKYSPEEIQEIEGFYDEYQREIYDQILYIHSEKGKNDFSIQGYSRMQVVENQIYYDDNEDVDLKNIVLNESGTDQEAAIANVEELIHSYINYAMQNDGSEKDTVDISPYYQEHYQVEADENRVFVIREFYIGYNKSTETIEDLFLSGYLLSRENE